jgi:hypothetical protein
MNNLVAHSLTGGMNSKDAEFFFGELVLWVKYIFHFSKK